ncbi:hypothetical protein I8F96_14375 [Enterococcus casseliflavus]|nr:hypothetical protein [Enterococcus casseliflavus]
MENNRVKFYGKGDLSIISFVPRIKEIINAFLTDPKTPNSIKEAIEMQKHYQIY